MRYTHGMMQTLSVFGGGGASEINIVAPVITPMLGAELITNPGFEGTYVAGLAPNWNKAATVTPAEENSIVHGGSSSQKLTRVNDNDRIYSNNFAPTVGEWYQASGWLYSTAGINNNVQFCVGTATNNRNLVVLSLAASSAWTQIFSVFRATAITSYVSCWLNNVGTVGYIDDYSVKQITFSSMISFLGSRSQIPGTYQCAPTVADNTACGILLAYEDENNFVMLIVNRIGTDQAQLIKRTTAGGYASVIAGNITYVAGQVLNVSVAGTNYTLFYNDVQIGGTTAITDAGLGTRVYGFNTYAGNTIGQVMTAPT